METEKAGKRGYAPDLNRGRKHLCKGLLWSFFVFSLFSRYNIGKNFQESL
ncbi:hypothetical protein BREVNS_0436 [Brevinematales bacterium NS]|nr:hypothetical protein BREVNS_0436 [Brevinematales bacterium NS]